MTQSQRSTDLLERPVRLSPPRRRRSFGSVEKVSLAVIVAGILLIAVKVVASPAPAGPVHSVAQVLQGLDARSVKHHTNPQSADADKANDCSLVDPADRKHVREQLRTQLQVGPDDSSDVDLVVVALDSRSNATKKATLRRSTVQTNGWMATQNDNLYVEIQAPASAVPPDVQSNVLAAVGGIATPASPRPPLLGCH